MWTKGRRIGRCVSWLRGVRVAVLTAVAGLAFLSPLGGDLEEVYGLGSLFRLRGPASVPSGIVLVAMDRASEQRFGPTPWPRTRHAELVRLLGERGAKAIIFDLVFAREGKASEDGGLSDAIRNNDKSPVALLQRLERQVPGKQPVDVTVDPVIGNAAAAVAAFPLPFDTTAPVSRFWAFRDGVPTLPAVALQLAASDLAADWAGILASQNLEPSDAKLWTVGRNGNCPPIEVAR